MMVTCRRRSSLSFCWAEFCFRCSALWLEGKESAMKTGLFLSSNSWGANSMSPDFDYLSAEQKALLGKHSLAKGRGLLCLAKAQISRGASRISRMSVRMHGCNGRISSFAAGGCCENAACSLTVLTSATLELKAATRQGFQ